MKPLAGALSIALLAGAPSSAFAAAQASGGVVISYSVTGAIHQRHTLRHAADGSHFCSFASQPWEHAKVNGEVLEVPPGPPLYEFNYAPGAQPPQPSVRFSLFNYSLGATTHNDPANDWIDLNEGGRHWVGHGGANGFFDSFTFARDGLSGRFAAQGLRVRTADGKSETIDIEGSWQCPRLSGPAG